MKKKSSLGASLYMPRPHNQKLHVFHLAIIYTLFLSLSAAAVFYALGYQINWSIHTIRQTGIIELRSNVLSNDVQVSLNGKSVSDMLPYRQIYVFPNTYTLLITKKDYQSWNNTIVVSPNKVTGISTLILVLQKPLVTASTLTNLSPDSGDSDKTHNIGIDKNELRLNDVFLTRTSSDISQATWYPDNHHLVYQAGTILWLYDLDGLNSQKLLEMPTSDPVAYSFQENGRVLLYQENGTIYQSELYKLN